MSSLTTDADVPLKRETAAPPGGSRIRRVQAGLDFIDDRRTHAVGDAWGSGRFSIACSGF